MNERMLQLRIGLMVLATLIIAGILLVMFGEEPRLFKREIRVTITFPEAPNVNEKTPVRRRGVLIGTVAKVEFVKEGGVRITAEIDEDKRPFTNEQCWITPSLMGDSNVNFVPPKGEDLSGQLVEDQAAFEGFVAPDPIQVVADLQRNLFDALESVVKTSDRASEMMTNVRDLFSSNEERIKTIVETAEANMNLINTTLTNVNDILNEESKKDIREVVGRMPGLLEQMGKTMKNADDRLADVTDFTSELGEQGPQMIARISQGVDNFNLAMEQVSTLSQALNSSEGSLGMMLHDRELYRNLNQAAASLDELIRQLRPVVNDARIFSDKIARHPELLGVRGAMQRNVGTKGVPSFPPLR